jgi:hypothetical protein
MPTAVDPRATAGATVFADAMDKRLTTAQLIAHG